MCIESYNEAKKRFLCGDYSSTASYFERNGYLLELGYCKLLSGDLFNSKKIFEEVSKYDFRASWARRLIQFIEGRVYNLPSYFQIRNFLEIDLNFLIQAQQPDFVESIINGADIFYSINQESYKFIARVMFFNDFDGVAFHYLTKAKDKFYYDPEMHLMLATYYLRNNDEALARKSIQNCLSILPNYLPAKKLLLKLS